MAFANTVFLTNHTATVMSKSDRPGRLKLVLLGNQHVGKTSLLTRYIKDVYNPIYTHTRGGDIFEKMMLLEGRNVQLSLVDTAGQADVKSLVRSIFRDANGIMLVYDVTNERSFEMVEDWFSRISEHTTSDPHIMLVGNKQDLSQFRVVQQERARIRAHDISASYIEVSAKSGKNVIEAFDKFITETWKTVMNNSSSSRSMAKSMIIEDDYKSSTSTCCS